MEVQLIPNFIDVEDCNKMINRIEQLISVGDIIVRDDGRVGIINKDDEIFNVLVEKYKNKKNEIIKDDFIVYNGYISTKYNTNIGMEDHIDSAIGEEMGILMYLNDDYEGGEFTYTDDGGIKYNIKAKKGDMIYCPSWFLHGVNKVTSGVRYFFTISLLKSN